MTSPTPADTERNERDKLIQNLSPYGASWVALETAERLVRHPFNLSDEMLAATRDLLTNGYTRSRKTRVERLHRQILDKMADPKKVGEVYYWMLTIAETLGWDDKQRACRTLLNYEHYYRMVSHKKQIDLLLDRLVEDQKNKRAALIYKLQPHEARRLAVHFAIEFFYAFPDVNQEARKLTRCALDALLGSKTREELDNMVASYMAVFNEKDGQKIRTANYYFTTEIALAACSTDAWVHQGLARQLEVLIGQAKNKRDALGAVKSQVEYLERYLTTKVITWTRPFTKFN